MSKKYINTLDYYGYGENNKMDSAKSSLYKVKVSDKDGNIITIEKDDSLYACVGLELFSGVLSLIDKAHDDSILAEIEFPNAGEVSNCRYDEDLNAILFDILTLNGETQTVELDVASLVELYEAGQGIEIGEKNEETGRKPISVKLVEGEELLTLSDEGLGLNEKVVTDEELESAISGKADTDYVESLVDSISGLTSGITEIEEELEEIYDELDNIRSGMTDMDEEIGELSGNVETLEDNVDELSGDVATLKEDVETISGAMDSLEESVESISGDVDTLKADLENEIEERKTTAVSNAEYDSSAKTINFYNINRELVDSIDATEFIKDGMVDSVELTEISGDTYLHIVFNTDAGKEDIYLNIGDIFNTDDYYTKDEIDEKVTALQEMDAALANVDTQQWAVINQNRLDMEAVDRQLWEAIGNEITARENADNNLREQINEIDAEIDTERAERIAADNAEEAARIAADHAEETARIAADNAEETARIAGDAALNSKVDDEKARAMAAEREIANSVAGFDERIHDVEEGQRELGTQVTNLGRRVDGFEQSLADETAARMERDEELADAIAEMDGKYATKQYVDTKDSEVKEEAISTAISSAKTYTDNEVDALEVELKQYCDDEHQELLEAISDNTTKINVISNLKGVSGDDASHYDDSGNGILDVLHREFHQLEEEIGYITNPTLEKNNPPYETAFGRYNASNTGTEESDRTIFSIGIGTSDADRKNALEIRENGDVYMWIEGEYMKVNPLIGMLAHEIY